MTYVSNRTVIWLNEDDVRAAVSMPELIAAMQSGLVAYSQGRVEQPVRSVIEVERNRSFLACMPCYAPAAPALGAKLVTVYAGNSERGLPSHLATILLLDPLAGGLVAVMDGRFITEARTAAVSAVAAIFLAPRSSRILAIIGSSVQARSHLEALSLVMDFEEIRCWSPTTDHLMRFVAESEGRVSAASSAEEAVRNADVVALVTSATQPVLRNEWVRSGAFVISVGACRPNQREMDPALVARGRLIVDSRAAALQESGDVVLGIAEERFRAGHIAAELGEVVAEPALGRRNEQEVTIFKSLGLAFEDLMAAKLVYERAVSMNRGVALA